MFFGGGASLVSLAGVGLGCHGLMLVTFRQASWKRSRRRERTGVCTAAFAAVKLLPTLALMAKYPKVIEGEGGFSVVAFATAFVDRTRRP